MDRELERNLNNLYDRKMTRLVDDGNKGPAHFGIEFTRETKPENDSCPHDAFVRVGRRPTERTRLLLSDAFIPIFELPIRAEKPMLKVT